MTTYDKITNRTTVWVRRKSKTAAQQREIEWYGEWKPLFWFRGRVT